MISVIVPVVNEVERLQSLLGSLAGESVPHEVIVVDGGSDDGSARVARSFGARVVVSARGRGEQLCVGVARAHGDILWFLHADSRVPAGAMAAIAEALAVDARVMGGNFRLVFDGERGFTRLLTGFYAWLRRRGIYYGDSGVFARRESYNAIGGLRPIALMEDYDFNRRLQRSGPTVCIMEPHLVTSSRRFENRHPLAIVTGWMVIHALFYLGVDPVRLARLYRSDRQRTGTGEAQAPPPAGAFNDQS